MAYNGNGRKNGNGAMTPMRRGSRPDNRAVVRTPNGRPARNTRGGRAPMGNSNGRGTRSGPFVTNAMHNQMHGGQGHPPHGGNWVIKGTSQRWTGPVVNAGSKWMTGNAVTGHSKEVIPGNQQPTGKTRGTATRR